MFDEFEAIEQRLFKALLMNVRIKSEVTLKGTANGFELFIFQDEKVFKLYTQRKTARVFHSPNTAINFLADMGVTRIVIDGLNDWNSDTYVNQNSRSKKKKCSTQIS